MSNEIRLINANALKKDIEENSIILGGADAIEVACAKALIDNAPTIPNEWSKGYHEGFQTCTQLDKALYERPQGKWLFKDLHNGKTWYECSICRRKIHIGDKVELADFPFCHCGADMRGKENE